MSEAIIKFPAQSKRLLKLLADDQAEYSSFVKKESASQGPDSLSKERAQLHSNFKTRANESLAILEEIGDPSLSNLGSEAAMKLSVIATHDSLHATKIVLAAFNVLCAKDRANTHYQSIPAMTDWTQILQKKPQVFGTIWKLDDDKYPFLITVENFDMVNERREEYGVGPLRWPKSLAIPLNMQPWLNKPLTELVMRGLTDKEWVKYSKYYL